LPKSDEPELFLLKNGWEYRWDDSPFTPDGTPLWTIEKQGNTNWIPFSLTSDPENLGNHHYIWERVKLPEIHWKDACLFIYSVDQIYEVYLESTLIDRFGDLNARPVKPFIGYGEHTIHLPDGYEGKTVYFRIYSEIHRIGILREIYIGSEGDYFRYLIANRIDSFFLGFISILAGMFALVIFFIGIKLRDRSNYLIFSGTELVLGVFLVCQSYFKIVLSSNYVFWQYLDLSSAMALPAMASLYLRQILELRFRRIIEIVIWAHAALFAVSWILDLTGAVHMLHILPYYEILALVTIITIVTVSIISAFRGNVQTRMFCFGFIALAVMSGFDLLVELQILPRTVTLFSWGAFLFSVSLAVILFRNYSSMKHQLVLSEKELEIARSVQEAILTSALLYKKIDKLDIEVRYLPMNKAVGGDYYNISRLRDGIASIIVADASGHGTQAALSTMQIDVLNKESLDILHPNERLEYMNETLSERIGGRNFFTAFLINIDAHEIHFSSAGHPIQYLVKKGKKLIELHARGKPLGFLGGHNYELGRQDFSVGDTLIMGTDGLFEEFNTMHEMLGEEGFKGILERLIKQKDFTLSPDKIATKILDELERFNDGAYLADDITLIVVKYVG
jgi:serine phosphatase RsbU (regulator of sigma subunit)